MEKLGDFWRKLGFGNTKNMVGNTDFLENFGITNAILVIPGNTVIPKSKMQNG